jgi:hypothetical protein
VRVKGDTESKIGCGLFNAFLAAALWWAGYALWYAPGHRDTGPPPPLEAGRKPNVFMEAPDRAVRRALAGAFPAASPRLEFMKGGNLNVYVTRQAFETVPFPDRDDAVAQAGKSWCSHVALTFMPSVRFRDIRTGEQLGKYSCTSAKATLDKQRQ